MSTVERNAASTGNDFAPSDQLAPGTIVDGYRIDALLGRGGTATVYAATHATIEKRAAIKVLSASLSCDPTELRRFLREAQAVNAVGHENIVDIFSFGELPDRRAYFIMEMLAGDTLYDLMKRRSLALDEILFILSRVAAALAAAHRVGIVHRDVKPENIFVLEPRANGVSDDFIETITRELEPGRFAVIAEVSEDWLMPIDMKMEALGGKVVRANREEFIEERIDQHADAVYSEIEQRKAERAGAKADRMAAKLDAGIEEARHDLQETATKARQRLAQKTEEMTAKIGALQAQARKAKPEVISAIDKRITEIRADLQARELKLSHALEMAEQALS